MEENVSNVADINTTCLILWNEYLFEPIHDRLIPSLLQMVLKDRKGETIDIGLLAKITNSFVMFGIDKVNSKADSLEIYQNFFETPFISATQEFYKAESESFIGVNPVTEYMKKVHQQRYQEYLTI
jgi:cullin 1